MAEGMTPQHDFWGTLSEIGLALAGVATLALIVSNNATTTNIIQATGQAFSNSLGVALSPVTGAGTTGSNFPIA
jgi:hypothetical protein